MAKGRYRFNWRKKRIPGCMRQQLAYRRESAASEAAFLAVLNDPGLSTWSAARIITTLAIARESCQGLSKLAPKGLL